MEENRRLMESAEEIERAKLFRSPNAPKKSIEFLWKFYPYRDGFFRPLEKDGSMKVSPYYTAAHIKKDPNGHYPRIVLERVDFQKMEEPDYKPMWICMCDACAIRTKAVDSPEEARDAWNDVKVTRFSRMLFRKLTVDTLNDCGVENLLYQLAKNSSEELVELYRTRRKVPYNEELEMKIRELERFFRKSPFLRDLNREELLRELRAEGEHDKEKLTPEERIARQKERDRKRYAERTNKDLRGLWHLSRKKKPGRKPKAKEEDKSDDQR